MQTIYAPSGKAREYSEEIKNNFYSNLALNIYKGCPHACTYCYVPRVLHKTEEDFLNCVEHRDNIVEETKRLLDKGILTVKEKTKVDGKIVITKKEIILKDKTIFLSFTSDPFPIGSDHTPTYEIIKAIKDSGNFVRILTKGNPDIDKLSSLLSKDDVFGVTISCFDSKAEEIEPTALSPSKRLELLAAIKLSCGCRTFVSCEPVYEPEAIYGLIRKLDFIDEYKIGKLNYAKSDIDWGAFGRECERLCKLYNRKYMIKTDLLKEMNR